MDKHILIWAGNKEAAHGAMLRGEVCNDFILTGNMYQSPFARGRPFFMPQGRAVHIHQPINHMGYSARLGNQFVIISLN